MRDSIQAPDKNTRWQRDEVSFSELWLQTAAALASGCENGKVSPSLLVFLAARGHPEQRVEGREGPDGPYL